MLLTGDYSEDDSLAMLRYFGPGKGSEYCGAFLDEDGFNGMLKFSGDKVGYFIYVQPGGMACTSNVKGFLASDAADDVQFIPINVGGIGFVYD